MGGKTPKPKEPEISDEDKMFNSVFEFNMMAKNYRKESEKSAAAEKLAIKKVKIAIEKNDPEAARIAAQDAIRSKNEINRYLSLGSKLEAVSQRLKLAYKTTQLTKNMESLTQTLSNINDTMSNFEKMFDNLDVQAGIMDQVMDNVNANSYAESDVNTLISQVAEENGMKMSQQFAEVGVGVDKVPSEKEKSKQEIGINK